MEAHAQKADVKRFCDAADLGQVGMHLVAGLVQVVEELTGQFELSAGFQRDGATVAVERDRPAFFQHGLPAESLRQPLEHCTHRARTVIGQWIEGVGQKTELFVLGADAPFRFRAAAGLQPGGQVALVGENGIRSQRASAG